MSQENFEVVRRLYEAIARRDADTVVALYDPEVTADFSASPMGFLTGGRGVVYHGHKGLQQLSRDWNEAWADVEYEIVDLSDAGEHVIGALTYRGRGRASGAEVEETDYPVWTIRDGKIVRVVWTRSRPDALEAVGPSE